MPYYRGTSVPNCFSKWDSKDQECDVCQVEAMCCQAQEDKIRKSESYTRVPVQSAPGKSWPASTSEDRNGTSITVRLPPDEHILPKEGESAVSRLGKNIAAGCLKETGLQFAIFFSRWKFP